MVAGLVARELHCGSWVGCKGSIYAVAAGLIVRELHCGSWVGCKGATLWELGWLYLTLQPGHYIMVAGCG